VLILRFWAVYGGSAALLLWLAHRFVRPLRLPVACLLALGPCVIAGKAMVTGGVLAPLDITYSNGEPLASYGPEVGIHGTRTPLLSDVTSSYIPSRKAVREAVKNGRLPLWNRFSMGGEPLLAFQQPAALHPATWLGFALPLANAWTFEMAFRLLLAMLSAYLFFRELDCGELAALLAASGWALCDHLIFWLGYSVTASVAAFPLLLLGLSRLARKGGASSIGITAAALVLITLGGHPETLLHTLVGGGVYFLFELAWAGRARAPGALGGAVLSGVLCLGLTAVVLLPFTEILPHTSTYQGRSTWYAASKKSVSLPESLRRTARDVLPYAFGLSGHGRLAEGFGVPAAYAGALAFPLAAIGFGSRRKERWAFALLLFLGAAFWARLAGVVDGAGKLPLLDIAVNDYLVVLASFGLVALAALGLDRIIRGDALAAFCVACLVAAALIGVLFVALRGELLALEMNEGDLLRRLALQCVPLVLAAAGVFAMRRRPRSAALSVLGLFVASRALEATDVYPTCAARAFYPVPEILKALPAPVPGRVAALGLLWIPDMSAMYELEDVRGYEAMTLASLVETYPLWCVAQPVWFNRVDDASRPFLSFLNVRYVFAGSGQQPGPTGWELLAHGRGGRIFENPSVLPKAFVPGRVGWLKAPSRQLEIMARVTDFGVFGVVERGANRPSDSEGWEPNGPGAVRIVSDAGQRLLLDVEAAAPAVVGTSLPRWPGWKVRLDGVATPVLTYNRAFVGFSVPAGRHRVTLDYFPDGFAWGAGVSGATLAVTLVLLLRMRAWRASEPRT
jgi:hypothetical protein